jgi:hypothetical protein
MSRTPLPKRLSVSEDIMLIREKNNNRKKELLEILKITDNNYTIYELEQLFNKQKYQKEAEQREKDRLKERQLKLRDLGMSINSEIDDAQLEDMYIKRIELRKRLQKQTDEFNISQYRKKYPENNTITTYHFTSYTPSFHNPGGATIYTQSNAANSMVFNQESGIYEPCDF